MAAWKITTDGIQRVQQRLQNARLNAPKLLRQTLEEHGRTMVQFAIARYLTGGTTADRLAVRSGALRGSLGSEILANQGTGQVTLRFGYINNPPVYANVQEGFPGRRASTTIRAKKAQYLTIPLPGVEGTPGDYANTFTARSRKGNLIIFQREARGQIRPLFLLRNEVVIPVRPAIYPTADRFAPLIVDALRKQFGTLLQTF